MCRETLEDLAERLADDAVLRGLDPIDMADKLQLIIDTFPEDDDSITASGIKLTIEKLRERGSN